MTWSTSDGSRGLIIRQMTKGVRANTVDSWNHGRSNRFSRTTTADANAIAIAKDLSLDPRTGDVEWRVKPTHSGC